MGRLLEFLCPSCGYRAEVAGRPDAGMSVCTTTITCAACRQLHDIITWERVGGLWVELPADQLRCPRDRSRRKTHAWQEWTEGGPCPRCGSAMGIDPEGRITLWD